MYDPSLEHFAIITILECSLLAYYFQTRQVVNICRPINVQKQADVVVFYLSVSYFSINFSFLSAFIACLIERELLTSDSLIQNVLQKLTSQDTANANQDFNFNGCGSLQQF